MLKRVGQELEYRIDVCHVTRGAHIASPVVKKVFISRVFVNNTIKVGPLVCLL
jgi:hypothetical protein